MSNLRLFKTSLILISILWMAHLQAQTVAIKAKALVDPASATVMKNPIILVGGREIAQVGTDVTIPEDAEIVDLSDRFVLPGLFDCHTHVCANIRASGNLRNAFQAEYLNTTTVERALQGIVCAESFLEHGFTTLRDVGNAGEYADIGLQRFIRRGLIPGPNLLVSGKIIAPFGGQSFMNSEHLYHTTIDYIFADTRDEMRKAVRQNIHLGVDWIKIIVDDQRYVYTPDDIRFIVGEAANAGVKVAAHCLTERGAVNAIEGGVTSIEHGPNMSDETLKLAKKKGVWLVGTDFSEEACAVYGPALDHDFWVARLKRAHTVGVRMAFGSDLVIEVPGHSRGSAALTFIDSWVEADIPPEDILRAFTCDAAELLDMADRRGRIKEGYRADIIAVPENPLDDIYTLRDVSFVMKDGQVYKHLDH